MSASRYVLEARALSKSFGGLVGLHKLDLAISPGEVFCLLGANGAGKTTTIKLFLGFHKPDQGSALVNGIKVAENPLEARRHLAYLPESVALYGKLSGLENMAFFDGLTGHRRSENELSGLLLEAGLPKEAHERRTADYSKGMRQKVGIAIAMAKGARAILLDEPLSGLDPAAANALGELIGRLRENGCAVLMATHDIFRAKEIGDRIGIMMQGRLVTSLPADSLNADEIEAVYLKHLHQTSATNTGKTAP